MSFTFPTRFDTARLTLRASLASDADALFAAYTQDASVCHYMIWQPHASVEVTREFLESCVRGWAAGTTFAYVLSTDAISQPIGMLEARLRGPTIELGYVLARAHWGKGYMPEAIRALAQLAFTAESISRIEATCDVENVASARTLEKSGFVCEGRLAKHTVHPNISREARDCFLYSIAGRGRSQL